MRTTSGANYEERNTNVASSTSAVTLLEANDDRTDGSVFNDSTSVMAIKFGTGASLTSCKTTLGPGELYEFPHGANGCYRGIVTGIWVTANGNARMSEGI